MTDTVTTWLPIIAAAITVITTFLKTPAAGKLVTRIPARWRIVVPIVLGGISGILYNIIGGGDISESIYIALFSGPSAVFIHEAVVEAILGKSDTRKGPKNAD